MEDLFGVADNKPKPKPKLLFDDYDSFIKKFEIKKQRMTVTPHLEYMMRLSNT